MSTAGPDPSPTTQRLYDLLPAIYRIRDAERGSPLRELLEIIAGEIDIVSEGLDQLYDDQFIETCAPWVAPYIGDLVGYRLLNGTSTATVSQRAEVANTVRFRRRKGTATMLEQLANDVTGWPAAVVEYFERLATTQFMNHLRPYAPATARIRAAHEMAWVTAAAGAFDKTPHTVDVRSIAGGRGRHNISNIGIFLWRIEAVPLVRSPLVPHSPDGQRFRFDPLGADAPIFGQRGTEDEITHLAEPSDLPIPLARRWLADNLDRYYGAGLSLEIERSVGGAPSMPEPRAAVRICDLSDVPGGGGAWNHPPPAGEVAVDPVLGRLFFGTALDTAGGDAAFATFHYGLAVPVGARGLDRPDAELPSPRLTAGGNAVQPDLDAVETGGTLLFADCGRYPGPMTVKALTPAVGADPVVVVVRAEPPTRPGLLPAGPLRLAVQPRTSVVLDGLLVAGAPVVLEEMPDNETRTVVLRDCTLVPGHRRTGDGKPVDPKRASLLVLHPFAQVTLERCVVGPIVAVEGARIVLRDCIVDASAKGSVAFAGRNRPGGGGLRTVSTVADQNVGDGTVAGGDLDLHECTVVGGIHATRLDASNSVMLARLNAVDPRPAAVWAERRQVGCIRFSFVPVGSRTGRRYRCVSDPAPSFTSLRFGHPAYAQLRRRAPDTIRRGADDESEMGASHLLFAPQRESNLLQRLDEYLRLGLEAGIFYAT